MRNKKKIFPTSLNPITFKNRSRRNTNRHEKYGDFNSIWICSLFSFLRWWRYTFWRTEKEKMVRVRSNRANHINLAQYLKKGKLLLVEGVLGEPEIWEDKQHVQHVQLSIVADSITFISTGKKKEEVKSEDTSTPPTDAPAPSDEDLPF